MEQEFTWALLATHGGATAATAVVVQFLKGWLDKRLKLPTQLLSYIIALAIMLAAAFFTGTATVSNAGIIVINAVVVSLASNGAFSALNRISSK